MIWHVNDRIRRAQVSQHYRAIKKQSKDCGCLPIRSVRQSLSPGAAQPCELPRILPSSYWSTPRPRLLINAIRQDGASIFTRSASEGDHTTLRRDSLVRGSNGFLLEVSLKVMSILTAALETSRAKNRVS